MSLENVVVVAVEDCNRCRQHQYAVRSICKEFWPCINDDKRQSLQACSVLFRGRFKDMHLECRNSNAIKSSRRPLGGWLRTRNEAQSVALQRSKFSNGNQPAISRPATFLSFVSSPPGVALHQSRFTGRGVGLSFPLGRTTRGPLPLHPLHRSRDFIPDLMDGNLKEAGSI